MQRLCHRLPDRLEWLRATVAEYIGEEIGHEQWILDDIAAAGGDPVAARDRPPLPATELMVAYAYDQVNRVNPVGLFGMAYVLEGTSVALAGRAADSLRRSLSLPKSAFRYLTSHGSLDQEHIQVLAGLLDRLADPADRSAVIHAASMFYRLCEWGGIDILINLAGVLDLRRFQDSDPANVSRLLAVNLEAPMLLTREVLPGMLQRGHGRIVNVGSMFGSIAFPLFASYSATKFALRGFSRALRRELVSYVQGRAGEMPQSRSRVGPAPGNSIP